MLHIETFVLGAWQTNCFVLHREGAGDASGQPCFIVDAGIDPAAMVRYIQQHRLTPKAILLTHAHLDHIAGLPDLRDVWPDLPIRLHEAEHAFLTDPKLNLSASYPDGPIITPPADGTLAPGDDLTLDGLPFEIRHVPGHSPGSVLLHQPDSEAAIVGDTLFRGGVGRFDFPTSDGPTLLDSLLNHIMTLPDATRIHPGHGPATTIATERQTNPYLQEVNHSIFESA